MEADTERAAHEVEPEAVEEEGAAEPDEATNDREDEELLARAQRLISKINAAQENPNPSHFHALASMLEAQEERYLKESASSSYNGGRASHTIGRLANILNENDDFIVSISTKFLSDNRYSVGIRAAASRLLLSGSSTWMVFDDTVIENAKNWVMEDSTRPSKSESVTKDEMERNTPTDSEMLKTYATGILAITLTGGGEIVEDMLTSGLSAKLMRYLRLWVLGDPNTSHKDVALPSESKHSSGTAVVRGREDGRVRLRNIFDGPRIGEEGSLVDLSADRDSDRSICSKQTYLDGSWQNDMLSLESELADSSEEAAGVYNIVGHAEEMDDLHQHKGIKLKYDDEDADENGREELSRKRGNRGLPRTRGKGRIGEGAVDTEGVIMSPAVELQINSQEQNSKDRILAKTEDAKRAIDMKIITACKPDVDHPTTGENDDRFCCTVGLRDISDLVKKAVLAAEAEASVVNAPVEAIRAAGDAAAELVKTSALEAWKRTNDSEAAVLAASEAASTVVDAALASELSHSNKDSTTNKDSAGSVETEPEMDEEPEDLFILDCKSLAQLREKYCIQCLEILGEYVEALGPVLHEKGVDVCLALLQKSSNHQEPHNLALLPEVLKLICALAAHRKFAALFVDRGGIQKLLSVKRDSQSFFGLSSCLFTIGSLQGIMERVCALPSDVVNQVVELALQLLDCCQDQARKNAAIFFSAAFVFRAILDSFDAQDGLQKMLSGLQTAASVRSGGNSGTLNLSNTGTQSDRPPSEVLTASEKQIAYHTCVALRQYFRAHLLLLVDSLRLSKSNRSLARSNARAAYKPLDLSNEAMDAVFLQVQRDRKFGPIFARARWPAVDKFLAFNGHITMLELCQAPVGERYLHDLAQYALGVLHIITLTLCSRKLIVNASLSNDRVGMAVILDAANGAGFVDPEVIHPALEILVNLVCPPPSISIKPAVTAQSQQPSFTSLIGPGTENRERNLERNISDRSLPSAMRIEPRERNGESNLMERGSTTAPSVPVLANSSQTCTPIASPTVLSGVVGDRRISLGAGAGSAGLAAQLEQGYRQAREAVRANNGIKVLLHLLHPRMVTPPGALDRLRALACRVLLGLARDDAIAHILTKLQVGKKLSELIRDSGSQSTGAEQGRWQSELVQVAIELIAIVTNSGRASTLVATDAAAPTLRRIERAAIAAATPISYHSKELLLLIHEHLQASGLTTTAALLQKEASLTPLSSLTSQQSHLHQTSNLETPSVSIQWPCRSSSGLFMEMSKAKPREEDVCSKNDSALACSRKKQLLSPSGTSQGKNFTSCHSSSTMKLCPAEPSDMETPVQFVFKPDNDANHNQYKTPILLPMKRKFMECKESSLPTKRLAIGENFQSSTCQTKVPHRSILMDTLGPTLGQSSTPRDGNRAPLLPDSSEDLLLSSTPISAMASGLAQDPQTGNQERMTLDALVVQYLKHQHRQCPAPITTLPPLSLLHPHVCPEPSRNLDAPINVTARLSTRETRKHYSGIHAHRRDRQLVYSRFRSWRTCRDDGSLLTCITFLGNASRFATGVHSGELKVFDSNSGNVLESNLSHQSPVMFIQSAFSGDTQLILSSGSYDVKLWDASSISSGPSHSFEGCKAACFGHLGTTFAALSSETPRREVLLYDIQKLDVEEKFIDNTGVAGQTRGHVQSRIHFSPLDTMLLWNGILWDRRCPRPVHHFDQFTDFGGGGFHPAGNEVIINSEVWDLRKFKLLRSVPSLDQTVINFNAGGDVIYAILRRNVDDITSAVHTRRIRHPLFAAFRTIDATSYSDIATIPVDRCVLGLTTEPSDSCVGVVAMDDHDNLFSSARLYEIGRKRPTDDDSDPDDGVDSDEEDEDEDDSEAAVEALLESDLAGEGDSEADDMSNEDEVDSGDDLDDDADFNIDDVEFDGQGILEMGTDGEDDDSEIVESMSDDEDGHFVNNGFGL